MQLRFFLLVSTLMMLPHISVAETSRTISVSGTSVTRVIPDTIVWSVTVNASDRELTKAKQKSDALIKGILSTAARLGAPKHCLQTGYLNVSKEYERAQNGRDRTFKHFNITRTVTIKATDTSRFDDYLTALVKNTDMNVNYRLETSELETIRWKTRLKAVAIAQKKATAMAEVLDAKVGEPLKIDEAAQNRFGPLNTHQYNMAEQPASDGVSDGTFAAGSIPITVSVKVVFALK